MRAQVCLIVLAACLVTITVSETRNEFLNFICKKCEGCKLIEITSYDEEGKPIFDCESKCKICVDEFCTGNPKRRECRFCESGESVKDCAGRCQFGCGFCHKTVACKN